VFYCHAMRVMTPIDRRSFLQGSLLGGLWLGGASGLLPWSEVHAGAGGVKALRAAVQDGGTRVELELHGSARFKAFTLTGPDRLVIDLDGLEPGDQPAFTPTGVVRAVRVGRRPEGMRVVLDLAAPVQAQVSAVAGQPLLRAELRHGVIAAAPAVGAGTQVVKPGRTPPPSTPASAPIQVVQPEAVAPSRSGPRLRPLVVAIDAGHGGKDPGAVGRQGTREKDVVLSVARRLHGLFEGARGFKPVLVRNSDTFISLRKRTQIARSFDADLFISLHADGFDDPSARGSSVFALSTKGATSESARWLANRENAADLAGGVDLGDHDNQLASVLLDLSMTHTVQSSLDVGDRVLRQIGAVNRLHSRRVQQAGFVVLKSPDIPSILVETAFITNPDEERRLKRADFQAEVARSIFDGVRGHFVAKAPVGTHFAALG